jgi:CheY-like chemotaxis protein
MMRILLADDSPHAQRMGERILREEGFEVVSVTDGESAMVRLSDVDPDVIVADAFLPRRSGFDICRDEAEAANAGSDALLKKPFEASVVLDTVKPLAEAARLARQDPAAEVSSPVVEEAETAAGMDEERVRAAVTVALDAAMPAMIDEVARHVMAVLRRNNGH